MATHAALDVTTWLGGYDLTGDSNKTEFGIEVDPQVDSAYGDRGMSRVGGLESVALQSNGWWQAGPGAVDPALIANLGSALTPITVADDPTESQVAYFLQSRQFSYQMFGEVGSVVPFSLQAQAAKGNGALSAGAVRGRILKTKANVSATGATGTAYQLGAAASGQYLYAVFHVFSAGTTITAVVESDDANTFASATTRITFGPITTAGGTWGVRLAGPITDDWYRLRVTAITGTFQIAAAVGIK